MAIEDFVSKGLAETGRLTFRTSNGGFARSYPDRQYRPESANMSLQAVGMAERIDLGHRLSLYIHPSEEDQHFEKQEREAES